MHIGFLTIESPFAQTSGGGIAAYLRALIPACVERGHRVTLIANEPRTPVRLSQTEGVTTLSIHLPSTHWYLSKVPRLGPALALLWREIEWSWAFARAIQRLDAVPEVIESSETGGLFLGGPSSPPWIVRLHGSAYFFQRSLGQPIRLGARWAHTLQQRSFRRAAAITAPSRTHAQRVADESPEIKARLRVIPNPLQPTILQAAIASRREVDAEESLVLCVGRLAPVKGVEPICRAAQAVLRSASQVRFIFIGEWQMPAPPKHYGLNVSGRLRWLGHLPWEDVVEWYPRAALVVVPSFYETFGLTALEAAAFGVPVVATTAGALPEVIEPGVTGLLVPPGDSDALAGAILQLLSDSRLRRQLGQAGRERVLQTYAPGHVAEKLLQVYHQAEPLCQAPSWVGDTR
jgi:glycosyltransferase involved in cell wall biosynthesis